MFSAAHGVDVMNVAVIGDSIVLTDLGHGPGDSFDINYTASQITLTAHSGTQFKVGLSTVSTYTINTSQPMSLNIHLKTHANTVGISGDGKASLASIRVNCGWRDASNSVALNNVIADSVDVFGGRGADTVSMKNSIVNGSLRVSLRQDQPDTLLIDHSTVTGSVFAASEKMTADHATFGGRVDVMQLGSGSTFDTTASTFGKEFTDRLGRGAVVNFHTSADGANKFHGATTLIGCHRQHATLNTVAAAAMNDVTPKLIFVDSHTVTGPAAPTVASKAGATMPTSIGGTWDSEHAQALTVAVGSTKFMLGKNSQLSTPSTGAWLLDLTGVTLLKGTTTVTAVNSDTFGNHPQGTGSITITA